VYVQINKNPRYMLTTSVTPPGSGSISTNPAPGADGKYAAGTEVTLTASENSGYDFGCWSEDLNGSENTRTFTINEDMSVIANFSVINCTISGYVRTSGGTGISGVTMSGLPNSPSTDGSGYYGASVSYGWSGTVTPSKTGCTFSPASRSYSNLRGDQTGQDYVELPQPILQVAPTNQSVASGSGSTFFTVTNIGSGTMNWIPFVASGDGWARITSISNGVNGGTITVGYDTIPVGSSTRTAVVHVVASGATGSPANVTVTQAENVGQQHPADTNNDWRLTINEVTAYGAAWKQGRTWQNPPNPIPIDYMTRAGYLWKNGEVYHDNGAAKPDGWVTGP
jgi:hypothetical protein